MKKNFFIKTLVIFLLLNLNPHTMASQVLFSDFDTLPEEEILVETILYALRPVNYYEEITHVAMGMANVSEILQTTWSEIIKKRGFGGLAYDEVLANVRASSSFVRYCDQAGVSTESIDRYNVKSIAFSINQNEMKNFLSGKLKYPYPANMFSLVDTEMFMETPGSPEIQFNALLAKKLYSLQRSTGLLDSTAEKNMNELFISAPKLIDNLKFQIGRLSMGKPHIVPIEDLIDYFKKHDKTDANKLDVPKWLTKQSDLYFMDIPFTVHDIERSDLFNYEFIVFEVSLTNPEHTAYEIYPVSILKESSPVKISSTLEPHVKRGDTILSLGKLFNIELTYKNIKPTILSYGIGENYFYWKLKDDALKTQTCRRVFAILEVPKGEKTMNLSLKIRGRLSLEGSDLLRPVIQYFHKANISNPERMAMDFIESDLLKYISTDKSIKLDLSRFHE